MSPRMSSVPKSSLVKVPPSTLCTQKGKLIAPIHPLRPGIVVEYYPWFGVPNPMLRRIGDQSGSVHCGQHGDRLLVVHCMHIRRHILAVGAQQIANSAGNERGRGRIPIVSIQVIPLSEDMSVLSWPV